MINSLFTGNRNSLLAWPWLYPDKQQPQPVFGNQPLGMPFEGGMSGNKGSPVMAGGMPYPARQAPAFEGSMASPYKPLGGPMYAQGMGQGSYGMPRYASPNMRSPQWY